MDQLLEFIGNNTLLAGGAVMMALAVIFNELRIKAAGVTALSAGMVVQLINSGSKVIDVRDAELFAKGHIVDSINIPATDLHADIESRFKMAKSLVLVCDTGAKSGQCVATLRKGGLETAFSLQGGIGAWQRENLPVVTSGDTGD
jgi:rhodanese-related sulfurtransferase